MTYMPDLVLWLPKAMGFWRLSKAVRPPCDSKPAGFTIAPPIVLWRRFCPRMQAGCHSRHPASSALHLSAMHRSRAAFHLDTRRLFHMRKRYNGIPFWARARLK